jgi:hypothetical protein
MTLESIKFSIKEMIAIGVVLVTVTGGGYMTLDKIGDMGDDVVVMSKQLSKMTEEVTTLTIQMATIQLVQKQSNALQQWLLGEAIRDGWMPPTTLWVLPEDEE